MSKLYLIASGVIALAVASVVAVAGAGWLGSASAGGGKFTADLTGAAERPTPVTTDVVGKAEIEFSEDLSSASFELTVENAILGTTTNRKATQAHIHCGGPGIAGPIVVFLAGFHSNGWNVDGLWVGNAAFTESNINPMAGCGATMSALRDSIAAGNTYVNVHSVANPAGEARGQLAED